MKARSFFQWAMAAAQSVVLPVCVAAMLPMCFTSCTSEDNPAAPTAGKAVITVDNAAIYDQLGITDSMYYWLENALTIVDSVLIYDETGNLVTKLGAESSTMDPLTIEVNDLPRGTYTFVVWQNVIDRGGDTFYLLAGEQQLSTVHMYSKNGAIQYMWASGYATASVTVDGSSTQTTMMPQSPCSIIELYVDNLTQDKGYAGVLLERYDSYCSGVRLDPSLDEEDRWILGDTKYELVGYNYTGETTNKYLTFTHGDVELLLQGYIAENNSRDFILYDHYQLEPGSHAVFYFDMNRLWCQPTFFGSPEDFAPWKAERDAGILDFHPYLNWGCGVDEVLQAMQSKKAWDLSTELTPFYDQWEVHELIAKGTEERYVFNTEDGQDLCEVCIASMQEDLTFEEVKASLIKQGYQFAGKVHFPGLEPRDIFFSADGKTEVQTYKFESDIKMYITYQPTDPDDFQYIVPEEVE